TGEQTWEAQYVPPDDEIPQVAIVMAVAAADVAWIALPLWAEGDALVKTRPRGRITVEIGSQTFGPVVADPRGEAVVPVVVPPGVTQARQGKRMIPLGVPPTRTVHVAFGAAGPRADRAQTVAVYAIATTADGAPRRGAAIRLRSTRGALTALREVAPGLYQSWLSLEAGARGEVGVTAALDDAPAFIAKAVLSLASGPADRIAITADRERIRADQPVARLHGRARAATVTGARGLGCARRCPRGVGGRSARGAERRCTRAPPPRASTRGGRHSPRRAQGARSAAPI